MIVCHCMGISDRPIRRAAREGAQTVAEVAECCGAGTVCTGCHPLIEVVIEDVRAEGLDRPRLCGEERHREQERPGETSVAPLSAETSPAS